MAVRKRRIITIVIINYKQVEVSHIIYTRLLCNISNEQYEKAGRLTLYKYFTNVR